MVVIFNYKINERIGKGSFSSVYSAFDVDDKSKQYAVKILKMSKIPDQVKAKIKLEVDILSNTSHPNIIRLYDSFYHENMLYLVLERCKTDLYSIIEKNNDISIETKMDWIKQLLSGIIYLHKNKIIHRDLKPQNILLDNENRLKIIDFGFARYFGSEDMMNTVCGTPLFMSPELFITRSYDYKSDYWSLGIIMYLIIVGSIPYNAKNMIELMSKLKNMTDIKIPLDYRKLYEDDLINLVESMLVTTLKYRLSFNELLHDLFVVKNNLNGLSLSGEYDSSYNTIADILINTNDEFTFPHNGYHLKSNPSLIDEFIDYNEKKETPQNINNSYNEHDDYEFNFESVFSSINESYNIYKKDASFVATINKMDKTISLEQFNINMIGELELDNKNIGFGDMNDSTDNLDCLFNKDKQSKPIQIKQNKKKDIVNPIQSAGFVDINLDSSDDNILNNTQIYINYFSAPTIDNLTINMKHKFEPKKRSYFRDIRNKIGI